MTPQKNSFLTRADVRVLTAASNDELLNIHRAEHANLIITQLDLPGMQVERLCSLIRGDEQLRDVSMLMVCANNPSAIEQSGRCRANAVLLRPVNAALLLAKAQQLLEVALRGTYRVLLSATVEGQSSDDSFFCQSRNISATGMLIETDKTLAAGDKISFSFFLPGSKRVQATGKIVRMLEKGQDGSANQYGLLFTDLTPDARRQLDSFIEKKALRTTPADS